MPNFNDAMLPSGPFDEFLFRQYLDLRDRVEHKELGPDHERASRSDYALKNTMEQLAERFGMSVRTLSRYVKLFSGVPMCKSETIPLSIADRCLSAEGSETIATLWTEEFDIIDLSIMSRGRCSSCNIELRQAAKLCGFCQEELLHKPS